MNSVFNFVQNNYFDWLCDRIHEQKFAREVSYRKLLAELHSIEFTYSIFDDETRAKNGIDLRWKFSWETGEDYGIVKNLINGPCTVFEMMVALSISCESIMDDPRYGDRTGEWFWRMIDNLGLKGMYGNNFDKEYTDEVIFRFLNREYEPNGKGGLFTIKNCDKDLRKYGIWYQLCWYLDSLYT